MGISPPLPTFQTISAVLCSAHAGIWHQAALFQPHQFQISLQMHFKGGGGWRGREEVRGSL